MYVIWVESLLFLSVFQIYLDANSSTALRNVYIYADRYEL